MNNIHFHVLSLLNFVSTKTNVETRSQSVSLQQNLGRLRQNTGTVDDGRKSKKCVQGMPQTEPVPQVLQHCPLTTTLLLYPENHSYQESLLCHSLAPSSLPNSQKQPCWLSGLSYSILPAIFNSVCQ